MRAIYYVASMLGAAIGVGSAFQKHLLQHRMDNQLNRSVGLLVVAVLAMLSFAEAGYLISRSIKNQLLQRVVTVVVAILSASVIYWATNFIVYS